MLSFIKIPLTVALVSLLLVSVAWAEAGKLPAPQMEGGVGVFSAFKNRASAPGSNFPTGPISREELSSILWAASGLNRGNAGWTVPTAMGRAPYCRIYVVDESGVFLYNWQEHSLIAVSQENIKGRIGQQGFVQKVPTVLILVSDAEALAYFKDEKVGWGLAQILAGAMTQDIYLAAASFNIGARYIMSMHSDEIKTALKLAEGDKPICLMLLGK